MKAEDFKIVTERCPRCFTTSEFKVLKYIFDNYGDEPVSSECVADNISVSISTIRYICFKYDINLIPKKDCERAHAIREWIKTHNGTFNALGFATKNPRLFGNFEDAEKFVNENPYIIENIK